MEDCRVSDTTTKSKGTTQDMDVVNSQRTMGQRVGGTTTTTANGSNPTTTTTLTNNELHPPRRPRFLGRARSAPPAPGRQLRQRRPILQDHYRVDPSQRIVLPGALQYETNGARDAHDFFNLMVLVPVIALNALNWNWDRLIAHPLRIPEAWTGEWFDAFFYATLVYFVIDLVWILVLPQSVRSPATIIQHHIATLVYILIPHYYQEMRWCMGACMTVEFNTWFLIARRVFNKQGFPPWILRLSFVSIRVKVISILFYATWISIRCILYPYLLPLFYQTWMTHAQQVGSYFTLMVLAVPLHSIFCLLNLKWSYELLMSKIRYWRRLGTTHAHSHHKEDKGL
jgi:hypothetical protein